MPLSLHLISMPWASPFFPSIQIACLKAYIDGIPDLEVTSHNYSAFLQIPFLLRDETAFEFYEQYNNYGETPYLQICLKRYTEPETFSEETAEQFLNLANASKGNSPALTRLLLDALATVTDRYVHEYIAPNLNPHGINLFGFTLNYHQIYSSIYCAKQIQQNYRQFRPFFVFGGMSASLPEFVQAAEHFGLDGLYVIGEGERKLEEILRILQKYDPADTSIPEIKRSVAGVFRIGKETSHLHRRRREDYESQIETLADLPLPDYTEYFSSLKQCCSDERSYMLCVKNFAQASVEGTRGCFARCDFCSFNRLWDGFRKNTSRRIFENVISMLERYRIERVNFVDNVCDTWAEGYSDLMIERRIRIPAFMELRAHHPETFWTKLSLAGVSMVQIGVEAISPPLMNAMQKGTRVIQNLRSQKYIAELGIRSAANLITGHPRSTVEDVTKTREILEMIPHYPLFRLSAFALTLGSPLYEKLSMQEKLNLKPVWSIEVPIQYSSYIVSEAYRLPASLRLSIEVEKAWNDFQQWYSSVYVVQQRRKPSMKVLRRGFQDLVIYDSRNGNFRIHSVRGDAAVVYDLCHHGLKFEALHEQTKLPMTTLKEILQYLTTEKILLEVEDFYLSLAFRDRDELIQNLHCVVDEFYAEEAGQKMQKRAGFLGLISERWTVR